MKKTFLTISLLVSALAILLVGASLAYLTDKEVRVNEFTVGDVEITLTEDKFVPDSLMVPGGLIPKNPTITVAENSEPAYIMADVIINNASAWEENLNPVNEQKFMDNFVCSANSAENILQSLNITGWVATDGFYIISDICRIYPVYDKNNDQLVFRFCFENQYKAGDSVTLFENFFIPKTFDTAEFARLFPEDGEEFTIDIEAYAIQSAGFNNAENAFSELKKQLGI